MADLDDVTPEQWASLQAELDELARTDPEVRRAETNLDRIIWRITFYHQINERRRAEGKPPVGRHQCSS